MNREHSFPFRRGGIRFAPSILRSVLMAGILLAPGAGASGGESGWRPLLTVRFGNIDAIDAEDGDLAGFLKAIRNDGLFQPPLRTAIGQEIRNPSFYGLAYEGWIEMTVLVPPRPGPCRKAWVFQAENRDDYVAQLSGLGLAEFEDMEGMTTLREMDPDGNVRNWYMEWLPGNLAVFGADWQTVAEAKLLYIENRASRGLLSGTGGRFLEPDVMIRVSPPALMVWQDREPGRYWWRESILRLVRDLAAYWHPGPARTRLMDMLAERLIAWPGGIDTLDFSLWLEEGGVEWRLEAAGDFPPPPARSQLEAMRRLPERTALAYAVPITSAGFARLGSEAAELLLNAAGGLVTGEARETALSLWNALGDGGARQAALAWIPPPPGRPELGGARMLVVEWEDPRSVERAWNHFAAVVGTPPVIQAFSQVGWRVGLNLSDSEAGMVDLAIDPLNGNNGGKYYDANIVARMNGAWLVVVAGPNRDDADARRATLEYRAALAAAALEPAAIGSPDVRQAFTRVDRPGASFLAIFEPVRFLQLALIEAADWQPRSPDQHEPESAQVAREMLEYGSTGAWTAAGEAVDGGWRLNGGASWQSLARLSAALGITEAVVLD